MKQETSFYKQEINLCLKCIYDNQVLHIVLVDHLQKNKEGTQKRKEQEIFISIFIKYIYQKKLDKACFQHNLTRFN